VSDEPQAPHRGWVCHCRSVAIRTVNTTHLYEFTPHSDRYPARVDACLWNGARSVAAPARKDSSETLRAIGYSSELSPECALKDSAYPDFLWLSIPRRLHGFGILIARLQRS
jgi:hypothetical protein